MNNKINELNDLAVALVREEHGYVAGALLPQDLVDEKFAELIIKECIVACNSRAGNSDYNTGRMHCVSDIKYHFGITS